MPVHPFDLDRREFLALTLAGATAASFGAGRPASAQSRAETLLLVQELGPNSLDMQGVGSNQTVNGLAWNCYDRLMTYASKTLPDGTLSYDRAVLAPELAESWQVASDGMSCTFKLRKDATFHDGSPVTAKDVKWSFDRSVSVGGFPTFQMSAGSLEKPGQFVVVDDQSPGRPAARPSWRASTTGRAARCPKSSASLPATFPPPAPVAPCSSAATPIS
jgi:peptide/nickel transport system substrate-binding protein